MARHIDFVPQQNELAVSPNLTVKIIWSSGLIEYGLFSEEDIEYMLKNPNEKHGRPHFRVLDALGEKPLEAYSSERG